MMDLLPPPTPEGSLWSRFRAGARHPVRYLQGLTGEAAIYPLLILFGLNTVDELDRTAFGVLLPNIQEEFGLDFQGVLTIVAVVGLVAIGLQIPVAHLADRSRRIPICIAGALAMAFFSAMTGAAVALWMLYVARSGSALGKTVIDPTHNSLLADYYPVEQRTRIYSFHRAANSLGQFLGPILGGLLAWAFGWRAPFLFFAIPTVILVALAWRLREPVRGGQERTAMGASAEVVATEEPPPSLAEAWRMMRKVRSLQRIFRALPFLAAAMGGIFALGSLKYNALGLDEVERGFAAAAAEPFGLLGAYVGARWGMRLFREKGPGEVLRFVSLVTVVAAVGVAVFAFAPHVGVAVAANAVVAFAVAIVVPGVFASLSLAVPPRARSVGFSIGSLWVLPGLVVLLVAGGLGDAYGIEWGMVLLTPILVIGGLIISSARPLIEGDIKQVWATTAARSEVLYDRRQGKSNLLLVRGLDVRYGQVQILFEVDFEVGEGEIIALLGTNGAGKSTLLKAISGVVQAERGTVIFDGHDITHAPAYEIAAKGIAQVPGGQGVFPSLTVEENLKVAGWLERDRTEREARVAQVLELFPVLADRLGQPASNLSGGQQQMLALGMAFLSKPRLLMIDELSLGLAPVVVEQLLPIVRAMRDAGTTVILVEQSVNVALTVAETAVFMEKGEIRFRGPTAELLGRPDVLRSVFLEGATKGLGGNGSGGNGAGEGGPGAKSASGPAPGLAAVPRSAGVRPTVDHDATPAIEVAGLTVSFGGIRAVNDVSFAVAPGEILGIVGPNGAGKTTLFDLISAFTPADGGRVLLGGEDLSDRGAAARAWAGLGRSFQDARLFPALTVEETIAVALDRWVDVKDPLNAAFRLPANYDSEQAVAAEVDRLIELMGIESFRAKFVRELSTGSRRVVDLACVLAHRPSVVLLDEPSSGIAQREAEALAPLMQRIRDNLGASLLVIEHDMPLVTSVADRLLALDQGEVVAIGAPDAVLAHPQVVESYLGGNPEVIARSGSRTPSTPVPEGANP